MVGIDGDAVTFLQIGRHRLAQRQDAVGRGVPVMAVAQRLHRRLDDVLGRLEVRLADAEIDDAAAFGLERGGAGEDFERGFCAQAGQVFGELQQGGLPWSSLIRWVGGARGTALLLH